MDLRSSKMIGMTWNLRSACRNRWSASLEWAEQGLSTGAKSCTTRSWRPPASAGCYRLSARLRYIGWVMDTVSVRGSPGSGWFTNYGFAKLASTWFAGLLGLYAVYALIAFYGLPSRFPSADRAIMVLGPSTIALALLVSAATFAASAMRFHLLTARDVERRRIYWAQLGLFGLGAYLLVAIGAPLVRSMLPGGSDLPAETLLPFADRLSSLRLVVPIAFGVFAVLSGVAGSLLGRTISRSVLKYAGTVPWMVCFGLVGTFAASFLGAASLAAQHGFPSVSIIIVPLITPLIVVAALARREDSGFRSHFPLGKEPFDSAPLDPSTVDEILSRMIETRPTEDSGTATTITVEDDVADLIHSIRRVAGSRPMMSPAQVSDIVQHLATTDTEGTQPVAESSPKHLSAVRMAEFSCASTSLTAGFLVIGSMGGLVPSISSAAISGIVGAAIVFFVLPQFANPTVT